MNRAAVRLVARSEARRRRGSLAFLFVLMVAVGAVVLASLAGAHRSATVLDRYMKSTNQQDAGVYALGLSAADAPALLGAVPGVTQVSSADYFLAQPTIPGTPHDFGIVASPDPGFAVDMTRYVVRDGSLPAKDRPDQVALNLPAARALGLTTGDTLVVDTLTPAAFDRMVNGAGGVVLDGPRIELQVVGLVQLGEDLQGSTQQSGPVALASPAFWHEYHGLVAVNGSQSGVRVSDPAVIDGVRSAVSTFPQSSVATIGEYWADTTRSAINVEVVALIVFAVIALAAGALAVGQATARQVGADPETTSVARAVGFTRRERVLATTFPTLATGIGGLVVAVVVAGAVSGLFPLAIARDAEVSPGIRVDPLVLLVGFVLLAAAFVAWTLSTGIRRDTRALSPIGERPSRPIGAIAGIGTWIGPRLGVRLALDRGRARATVPTRSALVGITAGVAGVVAAAVFLASLSTAISTPRDYGWTWSARPDYVGGGSPEQMLSELASDDSVTAAGAVFQGDTNILGATVPTEAFVAVKGSVGPPVVRGRLPANAGEIALGESTLRDTGLDIGAIVPVTPAGGEATDFVIVGEVVGSQLTDLPDLGTVAVITPDAAMHLTGVEDIAGLDSTAFNGNVVLTYRSGDDRTALEARLADAYQLDFPVYSHVQAPGRLLNLDAMRDLVVGLLAFCALIASIALAHAVIVSTRRRGHELGVLAALGLVRRQLRSIVWMQALTLTTVGLVIGIPIGILIGRAAWRAATSGVGMVVAPTIPQLTLLAVALAAVVVGWFISLVPGTWAAHTRAGVELRSE